MTVTVASVGAQLDQLKVTVTASTTPVFLRMLGFGSQPVTEAATAEFLVPLQLGQPGAQMGSDLSSLGTANNYFFMRTEGFGTVRSQGDPFTTDPQPPAPNAAYDSNPVDIHQISNARGTDTVDAATLPTRGGYNYLIYVPPGLSADVQVFNPMFAPDSSNQAASYNFHEYDNSWDVTKDTVSPPTQYSAMEYSVYQVPSLFQHDSDVPLAHFTVRPIDAIHLNDPADISGGTVHYNWWNARGTMKTVNNVTPTMFHSWIDPINYTASGVNDPNLVMAQTFPGGVGAVSAGLTGGSVAGGGTYYRLRVDTMSWDGSIPTGADSVNSLAHKGYAVRVVSHGTSTLCGTCSVGALDDMSVFTPIQGISGGTASFQTPLFSVPASYKDQTLSVYIFDPGDVSGNNFIKLIVPAYPGHAAQQVATAIAIDNVGAGIRGPGPVTAIVPQAVGQAYIKTANSGTALYNGNWIRFEVTVPVDWAPTSTATSYWNLEYDLTGAGASATDTFGVQVSLSGGSPVHLLP